MDEWMSLLEPLSSYLMSARGMAIATCLLIALPYLAVFVTRSIWLTAAVVAAVAYPAWIMAGHYIAETPALWLGVAWQATIAMCVLAQQDLTNHQQAASLLSRIADIETRIDTFLDALDRRTAIVQELTRPHPTPVPAPHVASSSERADREPAE